MPHFLILLTHKHTNKHTGAVTSWRYVADEQLKLGMIQMMRYLHDGMGPAAWADKIQQLDPAVRGKLEDMCR